MLTPHLEILNGRTVFFIKLTARVVRGITLGLVLAIGITNVEPSSLSRSIRKISLNLIPVSNDISIIDFIIGDVLLPLKSLTISSSDNLLSLGSAFLGGQRFDQNKKAIPIEATGPAHGHVAMTYTALACLIILGDDLSRVAREPILASLSELQQEDGRFVAHHRGGESDCRFLYCSCAIAFMLGGVDGHVNVEVNGPER